MATKNKTDPVTLRFDRELKDDGTAKVTSGRKHRYKENVSMELGLGQCIGTLYVNEPLVMKLGNPDSFDVKISPVD